MELHDAAGNVEPKSRALADGLGRKEGIEDARANIVGNAWPVIVQP